MTKTKVVQPPCDYCDFKNMNRAAYAFREKNGRFGGFLSLNNDGSFDINRGMYKTEKKPNFCPNCGRDLREDATQDKEDKE